MRLLFVTCYYKPAYVYGGPSRSIPVLCEALVRQGCDVAVLTTDANGRGSLDVPVDVPQVIDGVTVKYLRRRKGFPGRYFYAPALGRECAREVQRADGVYICATWTYPLIPATRAALRAGVPYVVSPRGSFMRVAMGHSALRKRVYLRLVERDRLRRAAAVHCTSEREVRETAPWNLGPQLVCIPNGIDNTTYQRLPARGALRSRLGIPDAAPVSAFVGRLHREKRIPEMVTAFSRLRGTVPDAHLVVVGREEDDAGDSARQLVRGLGLSGCVHFTGQLEGKDLLEAYSDFDLLAVLSLRESFSMAAAEAMAAGIPVLLSAEVGIQEDVARAGAGLVVRDMESDLDAAWTRLLSSPGLRQEMGERAKRLVNEKYSSDAVASEVVRLFRSAAAKQGARP